MALCNIHATPYGYYNDMNVLVLLVGEGRSWIQDFPFY